MGRGERMRVGGGCLGLLLDCQRAGRIASRLVKSLIKLSRWLAEGDIACSLALSEARRQVRSCLNKLSEMSLPAVVKQVLGPVRVALEPSTGRTERDGLID